MAVAVYADDNVFQSLAYGSPRSDDRDFLRSHIESAASRLGAGGAAFVERARERFNSFDLHALDRKLDALKRKVRHAFDDDNIRPISRIGEFQQAGLNLQRWCMANSRVRRLVNSDRMHGWNKTYRDMDKGLVGDRCRDYQRVVNGLATTDEHGHTYFVEYMDCYDEDYREELRFGDQAMIRDVIWANLESIIIEGKDDPSDPHNGSL